MTVKQESKSYYQYIDFTMIAEYLFSCINEAIFDDIERGIKFLVNYDKTKKAIQEIIDMPDNQIDLLIKFVTQNNGSLSSSKRNKFFSLLTDEEIAQVVQIINTYMTTSPKTHSDE
jgi:hypothetical protein